LRVITTSLGAGASDSCLLFFSRKAQRFATTTEE
jgi:hypothetical protein